MERILLESIFKEMKEHLFNGIVPFWTERGIDSEYGGYLTCFDEDGILASDTDKYIVTQTRMIWGFSALGGFLKDEHILDSAKQGISFMIRHFWDPVYGGWFWKTSRDGEAADKGKLVYGQSFVIYAFMEYYRYTGDADSLEYSRRTFDLLQKYCTDTCRGGYYENFEQNWTVSPGGAAGGDRKSLDIHMHLMEAYTVLAQCTGEEIHFRKLEEVTKLIIDKMISRSFGCGLNQFDLSFTPIPAININRTWNAERKAGQMLEQRIDSTSYGHNLELAWLLDRAGEVLGKPSDHFNGITQKLIGHTLAYGFDKEYGGVYRDGPHDGPALVHDKEFWQNAEALVGFLNGYVRSGSDEYLSAFIRTWRFARENTIHPKLGEWRQLVDRSGKVIVGDLGNPWKAFYHTGRSMLECIGMLTRLTTLEKDVK